MPGRIPPKPSAPRPVQPKPVHSRPSAPQARPAAAARKFGDDFSNGRGSALRARALSVTGVMPSASSPSPATDARPLVAASPANTAAANASTPAAPPPSVELPGGVTVRADGHVSFTQEASLDVKAEASFEAGELSASISAGPLAGTEVTLDWNPAAPLPDGTYEVTLSVASQVGAQASGAVSYGPFGLSGGVTAGVSAAQEYTLHLTPGQIAQLGAGTLPLPSVADPLALPVGGSLMMSTGSFHTSQGELSYGGLSVSSSSSQTHEQTLAVEHTGATTVRVTVGPKDTLEQQFGLGLSVGELSLSLARDSRVEGSTLTSVEFDLATPEGAAAYERFLQTGELPSREGPGITDSYQEQSYTYEGALTAGIELGPLSHDVELWDENTSIVRRMEDGEVLVTAHAELATEGVTIDATFSTGDAVLNSLTFTVPDPVNGGSVRVTVDGPEGFSALRCAAAEQMQYALANTIAAEQGTTREQALEWLRGLGAPYDALAMSPSDPAFSYEAFTGALAQYESNGWGTPGQPMLTQLLLQWRPGDPVLPVFSNGLAGADTPDNAFGEAGWYGQPPPPAGVAPAPSLLDMGLGDLPGVCVESR